MNKNKNQKKILKMLKPESEIQYLNGVGPVMAGKLKRLGIEQVRDLLFYFPRMWQDFSKPQKIRNLQIGQDAIIKAKIFQIKQGRTRRKWMSIIEAILIDDGGEIRAIWFNQPFLMKILKPGQEYLFAGRVGYDRAGKMKILNVYQYESEPIILPVYSETEGLSSKYLRKLVKPLISQIDNLVEDYLPAAIRSSEKLSELNWAIRKIHFPDNSEEIEIAKKRLAFDELFLIALRLLEIKKELTIEMAPQMTIDENLLKGFVSGLSFKLTNAQRKAAWEIIKDLNRKIPMNRLLEGDVGSGKTIVAAMAVLIVAKNRFQSVWLAPTEILAIQHFKNISKLLEKLKVNVGLLTAASKKTNLEDSDLIIGTHALLQKNVSLPHLGLIIIDEQHRFGVKQRAHLRKGSKMIPHLLSMTATPIPRSLALALYGDLDISIIDEMPPGRQKIITRIVSPDKRPLAYNFIEKQIKSGRQVFVICPLIEAKDSNRINLFEADRKSVMAEYEKLSKSVFPNFKIGLMHGRLKTKEKEETMEKFHAGSLDIIVSTAVVEVGIDVSNATVMMIEGADRFGLAQLHQFRGRVGRGKYQSYCFLFAESWSEKTKRRLEAMTSSNNGFELAEKDLQIRGPGELIGIRQSGLPDLKIASLSDIIMVKKARSSAEKIIIDGIEKYPKLLAKFQEFAVERHLE